MQCIILFCLGFSDEIAWAKTIEKYPAVDSSVLVETQSSNSMLEISTFDQVPQEQKVVLLARINLVQKLIQEHGRAYDYKTMKLKELENTLNSLNQNK